MCSAWDDGRPVSGTRARESGKGRERGGPEQRGEGSSQAERHRDRSRARDSRRDTVGDGAQGSKSSRAESSSPGARCRMAGRSRTLASRAAFTRLSRAVGGGGTSAVRTRAAQVQARDASLPGVASRARGDLTAPVGVEVVKASLASGLHRCIRRAFPPPLPEEVHECFEPCGDACRRGVFIEAEVEQRDIELGLDARKDRAADVLGHARERIKVEHAVVSTARGVYGPRDYLVLLASEHISDIRPCNPARPVLVYRNAGVRLERSEKPLVDAHDRERSYAHLAQPSLDVEVERRLENGVYLSEDGDPERLLPVFIKFDVIKEACRLKKRRVYPAEAPRFVDEGKALVERPGDGAALTFEGPDLSGLDLQLIDGLGLAFEVPERPEPAERQVALNCRPELVVDGPDAVPPEQYAVELEPGVAQYLVLDPTVVTEAAVPHAADHGECVGPHLEGAQVVAQVHLERQADELRGVERTGVDGLAGRSRRDDDLGAEVGQKRGQGYVGVSHVGE